jgi:hypothetical protein
VKFDDIQSNFEPAPEGIYIGVLAALIDFGEQPGKWGEKRQARLKWVLPEVLDDKGDGFVVYHTVWNLSLRSEAFRDIVSALLPGENLQGRSLKELVGKAAKLTIEHNDTRNQVYANVVSVKPLKPGTKAPALDPAKLTYFSLDHDEFSEAAFNALSERDRGKGFAPIPWPFAAKSQPLTNGSIFESPRPRRLNILTAVRKISGSFSAAPRTV